MSLRTLSLVVALLAGTAHADPLVPTEVKRTEADPTSAVIRIAPLSPGMGQALGRGVASTLRKGVYGFALTGFHATGLADGDTAIDGVRETVAEISRNIARAEAINPPFKSSDFDIDTNFREVNPGTAATPGVITGADLEKASGGLVTVGDPKQVIATVTDKDVTFTFLFTLERENQTAEENVVEGAPEGMVFLPSKSRAVRSVDWAVVEEVNEKGQAYDALYLDVTTSDRWTAAEAVRFALDALGATAYGTADAQWTIHRGIEMPEER